MDNIHQAERHSLARILTQVVDQQQQCVLQFNEISRALESVRSEIRRTDENHHKEVDHLHEIIKQLMQLQLVQQTQNQARPQPQTPVGVAPQAYASPATAPTGQPIYNSFEAQQMAFKQQQMQMQWLQHQLQLQQAGGLTSGLPQTSKPLLPATASPLVQSLAQQQLKAPPTPSSTGTVSLPISSPQKPAEVPKVEPKVEVKKEVTPATSTPIFPSSTTTPTSTINFGGLANKTPAASSTPAVPSPLVKSSIFDRPASIFVKQATTPLAPAQTKEEDEDEDTVDEYEPQVEFQPVIPLPELIDVKTGEEDEIVLFEERCKLYRYASETKEWKERGIGNVKVLKHPKTGVYRVVMRREQIHKLCANFNLTKDMKISKMGKNTKACAWHCIDFSEEESSHEQLSAKFGSTEQADSFMKFFNEGVASSSGSPKKEEPKKEEKRMEDKKTESFGSQFIKKADEWDCQGCYTRQPATMTKCPCCGTNKDGSAGEKDIFSKPTAPAGASSFSFGLGQATEKPKFSFGMKEPEKPVIAAATSTTATAKPKFSFADAASAQAQEEPMVQNQKIAGFGASATGSKFSFGGASPVVASPAGGGSLFGGANKPTFSFAQKKEETPGPATTASPSSFVFKPASSPAPGKSMFGGSAASTASPSVENKEEVKETSATNKIFGQGSATGGFSFGGFAKGTGSIFNDDAKLKAQADFAKQKQSKFGVDKTAAKKEHDEDEQEDEDEEEYEPEVEFKPVIPLPDLIDVKTGEEDETVLFKERCKLYRYVTETKEWKERGTGEIKILKNPETNTQRIVMRREQTHKLCANFNLTKGMSVNKMVKNNKATQWICKDYSEGELAQEQFSAKFGSSELADKFVSLFTEATAH